MKKVVMRSERRAKKAQCSLSFVFKPWYTLDEENSTKLKENSESVVICSKLKDTQD